jgi:hypothetical protein
LKKSSQELGTWWNWRIQEAEEVGERGTGGTWSWRNLWKEAEEQEELEGELVEKESLEQEELELNLWDRTGTGRNWSGGTG